MNQNTVTGDYININLRQLGATSIKEFNSIMHIAEFDLGDGLIVSYVFNITRHNKYFLQRMQPYAMVHGKFASDQEIIDFITADLKRFENDEFQPYPSSSPLSPKGRIDRVYALIFRQIQKSSPLAGGLFSCLHAGVGRLKRKFKPNDLC
jgi:hypothetical protein